jgi:CBS domain-containing protein
VRQAKDIMTTDVATISATAMVSEAIGMMKERGIHDLIIKPTGSEKAFGIVTEADISYKVIAFGYDPKELTVGDIMTRPCITIKPDMSVKNVASLFANHRIHRAPVVRDGLQGIVSVADILRKGQWW